MPVNFGVCKFAKLQTEASEQVAVNLISAGRSWIIRLIRLFFFAVVFFPPEPKGRGGLNGLTSTELAFIH